MKGTSHTFSPLVRKPRDVAIETEGNTGSTKPSLMPRSMEVDRQNKKEDNYAITLTTEPSQKLSMIIVSLDGGKETKRTLT
jgi:hypothetical protein